jgi:hypothetical protein
MYRENKLYIQLFVFITIKRNFWYLRYYHQCSNGVPIRMKCPSGLHWTVTLDTDSYYFPTCDLPSQINSNCRKDTPF